jgi:hypothetical protein
MGQIASEALVERLADWGVDMQMTSVLGTGYQQEVNLDKLYADVVGAGALNCRCEVCPTGTPSRTCCHDHSITGQSGWLPTVVVR